MSKDLYFEWEKFKYDNLVVSCEYLLEILKKYGKFMFFMDICYSVNVLDEDSCIGI